MIETLRKTKPTAKQLILSLLSAPALKKIDIGHLIGWGRLFDIDDTATRVAAGRLVKQGLLKSLARGHYTIGPKGKLVADKASSWTLVEQKIGPWTSDWILVYTSHLGRTNKKALRARDRAFRLSGFAELVTGLWCRPSNYTEALSATKEQMVALGLDATAIVTLASDVASNDAINMTKLWPRKQIEADYRRHIQAMQKSAKRLDKLSIEEAASETFLLGEAVIRHINADPLLPIEMIDSALRKQLIEEMVAYNQLGKAVWQQFQLG